MAVPNMQSLGKRCKASCPVCTQSPSYPSPVDSDCLEKGWDNEIKDEEKMRKKQRKEKLEKASGYFPPELIYNTSPKREFPILVTDLVPAPIPGEIKSESQKRKE